MTWRELMAALPAKWSVLKTKHCLLVQQKHQGWRGKNEKASKAYNMQTFICVWIDHLWAHLTSCCWARTLCCWCSCRCASPQAAGSQIQLVLWSAESRGRHSCQSPCAGCWAAVWGHGLTCHSLCLSQPEWARAWGSRAWRRDEGGDASTWGFLQRCPKRLWPFAVSYSF